VESGRDGTRLARNWRAPLVYCRKASSTLSVSRVGIKFGRLGLNERAFLSVYEEVKVVGSGAPGSGTAPT
jgi:hypothetical protein